MPHRLQTKDYDFIIPTEKIALYPRKNPEFSPLLVVNSQTKEFLDYSFKDLLLLLEPNSILVINDTKVEKCRFFANTANHQSFEVLLLSRTHLLGQCKIRNSRKLSLHEKLYLTPSLSFTILNKNTDGTLNIQFQGSDEELECFFQQMAQLPLPPYILKHRAYQEKDGSDYQTVYAKHLGSRAAPTAGLHFTKSLLNQLKSRGIEIVPVELYVSLGTFQPIQTEYIYEHPMHMEEYIISEQSAEILNRGKREGRPIVAVGTTSLRTLESAWDRKQKVFLSGKGKTTLFISPGYEIASVNSLITNFHTPKSTLFVLICTILGYELAKKCYEHALKENYYFFSYGDAMFIQNILSENH